MDRRNRTLLHSTWFVVSACIALMGLILCPGAHAAENITPESLDLLIRHRCPGAAPNGQSDGLKEISCVEFPAGRKHSDLSASGKSSLRFEVGQGKNVTITLVDPNPLLFEYKVGDVVKVKTDDYNAIMGFLKSLTGLSDEMKKLVGEKAASPLEKKDWTVCDWIDEFQGGLRHATVEYDRISNWIAESYWDSQKVKREVDKEFEESKIPESIKTIREALKQFEAEARKAAMGNELPKCNQTDPARMIAFALLQKPDILTLLEKLEMFKEQVDQLDVPKPLKVVDYSATEKQTFSVTITRSANWTPEIEKKVKSKAAELTRKTGEIELTIEPYSPVHLAVGAAVVYSFVRNPKFTAEKQEDGTIQIKKQENEFTATKVSAMLEITPRALDFPAFSLPVQLGVTPDDKIGIYLGGAIKAKGLFSFGAGITFQQVNQLVEGLVVTQPIPSADKLKTEEVFKRGLYLHVTITVSPK